MKTRRWKMLSLMTGLIALLALILSGCSEKPKPGTHTSQVLAPTVYSKKMNLDWNYNVYLPAGYDPEASKTYPTIYLMHGLYGNHTNLLERFNSQQILDGIINRTGNKAVVVFVDGFNSFYVNQKDGLQVEDAIISDLVPTIQKNYKVSKDPEKTAIGGISMGGYGAARLALKYPDKFSKAILISPSVWYKLPKDNPIRMNMHAFTDGKENWSDKVYDDLFPTNYINDKSKNVKFYIESTDSDSTVPIKDVKHFVKDLNDKKISNKFVKDTGGNHNWDYWKTAAPNAYTWALNEINK